MYGSGKKYIYIVTYKKKEHDIKYIIKFIAFPVPALGTMGLLVPQMPVKGVVEAAVTLLPVEPSLTTAASANTSGQ